MRLKKLGFWGACSACTLFFCSDVEAMFRKQFVQRGGDLSKLTSIQELGRERDNLAREIAQERVEKEEALNKVKGLNEIFTDHNETFVEQAKELQSNFRIAQEAAGAGRLSLIAQLNGAHAKKEEILGKLANANSNIAKLSLENNELGHKLKEANSKANEMLFEVKGLGKIFPDGSRSFVDQAEELRRNFNVAHEAAGIGRLSLNAKILAAEEETERISQKKDSATRKIAELVNTLNKVTTEKDELKNQLNEAQGKATNLENQLNEANQKVADAESKSSDESRLFMNVLKAVYENTEDKVWLENIIQNSDDQQYAVSKLLDLLKAPRQ